MHVRMGGSSVEHTTSGDVRASGTQTISVELRGTVLLGVLRSTVPTSVR